MIQLGPTTLEGDGIRLEPLTADHHDELRAALSDGRLWELWFTSVPEPDRVAAYIEAALEGQRKGHMLPWAVRELESGLIAVEGVLLGSILGVLTTWLMYQKSATFETVRTGFPVEWITIAVLLTATLVLSLIATVVPARRASRIVPALAVRIAD